MEASDEEDSDSLHIVKPEDTPSSVFSLNKNNKGVKRKREEGKDDNNNKKRKIESNGETDGKTKVRLGNLSFELDGKEEDIKQLFSDCGEIKNVEMVTRKDGRFAGVAIIEFESAEGAASSLEKNETEFFGRKMFVTYAGEERGGDKPPSEKPEGCTTVFIKNLPYSITEEEVNEFFSTCGTVKQIRWTPGEFRGVGWVEFEDTTAPDNAMKLKGKDLGGRPVFVDYAAPRKKREW